MNRLGIGKGIAIAGIWIGAGLSCLSPIAAAQIAWTSMSAVSATAVVLLLLQ